MIIIMIENSNGCTIFLLQNYESLYLKNIDFYLKCKSTLILWIFLFEFLIPVNRDSVDILD